MTTDHKIIFFGTPEFSAYILQALHGSGISIAAVVTIPDKAQGRGQKLHSSQVKHVAESLGIPILTPSSLRDESFIESLHSIGADVFCVVAFKILPREVYSIPSLGSFNVHASLLPKYRGAAPINWAIMRGETKTGITTFLLADKVDTGNILLQNELDIGENETAGELHDRLMAMGALLAIQTIHGLFDGSLSPVKQVSYEATTAPKIFPKDCLINCDLPAEDVHNFIRGLSPNPGAMLSLDKANLKLLRSTIARGVFTTPGNIVISTDKKKLFLGTRTSALEVLELQREGRKAMHTPEFLNGNMSLFQSGVNRK